MSIRMDSIVVENFKSYEDITRVPIMNLSVFMGANSSGKSTALQPLLAIKQTVECNSPDIDLLLSGKYVALGDFADVINDRDKGYFAFGIAVVGEELRENYGEDNVTEIMWKFDSEAEKDACLCEVAFQMSGNTMKLIRGREHFYNIQVDGKLTPLIVKMNNLTPRRLYVEYNRQFNDLFYCFINDILKWVFPGKKGVVLPKDELASILTIEKMYIEMMKEAGNKSSARNKDGNSIQRTSELVTRIMDVLKKYCDYQFEYHASFWNIPQNFKENILFSCIYKRDDLEELIGILDKYERLIEEFPGGQFILDYDCQAEVDISTLYRLGNKEKRSSAECDFISDAFRSYREIFHKIIGKIFYVGPIREKPQGLYNIGFETIPKYVGTTGAYFASVLLNISVQGATNDIKKCFRYAEWKSQIFHSIFTYSLVALIDEIKPSVAFLLSSKLIFSQSSK